MIGIVTGIKAEAKCCRNRLVQCNGPGTSPAANACNTLLTRSVTGIISFGIAGSLKQTLLPGSLVLASEVILTNGHRLATDKRWRKNLHRKLITLSPVETPVVSSRNAVDTAIAKRTLATISGAGIVDMESSGVALRATSASIPFLVIRIVADPEDRDIPQIAITALTTSGQFSFRRILSRIFFQNPAKSLALAKLAKDSHAAFSILRRVIRLTELDFSFSSN